MSEPANRPSVRTTLEKLRRRKIAQWALAYLAVAWLMLQLVDVLGDRWGVSDSLARVLDVALITGFLIALVLAWYHGEKGRQWVSGAELLILASLVGLGALTLHLLPSSAASTPAIEPLASTPLDVDQAPWIAVLPVRAPEGSAELERFADDLTVDLISGLARFSHLLVLSANSTRHLVGDTIDVREIGTTLGARYVIEAAVRGSGEALRISAQLVDSRSGTTIWTDRFDLAPGERGLPALQDEVTDRLVATIGDGHGVVARTLAATTNGRDPETLSPYEAVLRWFQFQQQVTPEDHLAARLALEHAVMLEPGYSDAWACLADVYLQEYSNGYNALPDSRARALAAAQRAARLDGTNAFAHFVLAQTHYFRQDLPAFSAAMERAIELNPRDSNTLAFLGILVGYGGDWERSVALTTTAMNLNPNHPGWYYFNTFFNEYRSGRYEAALAIASRINLPGYWGDGLARSLAHARLGNDDAARAAARDLLAVWPDFQESYYERGLTNWVWAQPELVEDILVGLRAAGLEMVVTGGGAS